MKVARKGEERANRCETELTKSEVWWRYSSAAATYALHTKPTVLWGERFLTCIQMGRGPEFLRRRNKGSTKKFQPSFVCCSEHQRVINNNDNPDQHRHPQQQQQKRPKREHSPNTAILSNNNDNSINTPTINSNNFNNISYHCNIMTTTHPTQPLQRLGVFP